MRKPFQPHDFQPPTFGVDPTRTRGSEDGAMYPTINGLKSQLPWRLLRDGEVAAFSSTEINDLAARFDLTEELLSDLSEELALCLNEGSLLATVKIGKKTAAKRADKAVMGAITRLKLARDQLLRAKSLLEPLVGEFTSGRQRPSNLSATKNAQKDLLRQIDKQIADLTHIASEPANAFNLSPENLKRVSDRRRLEIIHDCCRTWRASGRKVSYTTTSDGSKPSQRSGPLIDFVQAVIAKSVTVSGFTLSPETIRKDIDAFKKLPDDS